jgi:hypothetical protein
MNIENRQCLDAWFTFLLWLFVLIGAAGGIAYIVTRF